MVYARTVAGQELTFGVSGKLIMNALVMYDHQTDTLWSQFLSLGVDGPLEGTRLELLPAMQTDWATWRDLHPDTLVLDTGGFSEEDPYARYYANGIPGIHGESNQDDRLLDKDLVLGIEIDGRTKAYSFLTMLEALLADNLPKELPLMVINDSLDESPLLVVFDGNIVSALAFDRTVAGQTLMFQADPDAGEHPALVDQETGTRWLAFTGEAVEGPLQGQTLRRIPSHYSYWFAWSDFYPDTELYTP